MIRLARHTPAAVSTMIAVLLPAWWGCSRPAPPPQTRPPAVASGPRGQAAHREPRVTGVGRSLPDALQVNNEAIETERVLRRLRPGLALLAVKMTPAEYERELVQLLQVEMIREVQETLLYQKASIGLTDPAVLEALERIVDQELRDRVNREFEGRQSRFEEHLRDQGRTLAEVREEVRRGVMIMHYLQETILPRISNPTRQQLWDYYQQNVADFTQQESRELFLIDIPFNDDAGAARAAADDARARISAGQPFEDVARTYSQGLHASEGGAWGEITTRLQGRYAGVSEVLSDLSESEVSDVVATDEAVFIVKAGRIRPELRRPFTEVQPQLAERYRMAQFDSQRQRVIQELLEKAVIEPDESSFLEALIAAAPSHEKLIEQHSAAQLPN